MPDGDTLRQMYGPEYAQLFHSHENMSGSEGTANVTEWLEKLPPGTFLDYGCGAGHLLSEAMRKGWRAVGLEFNQEVAKKVSISSGARVITDLSQLDEKVDLLHLGDVIEHLTNVNEQVPTILKLLKPGGLLLAQGPLENNPNLFSGVVRLSRRIRPGRRTEMAPYHVLLATATGQREFFRRFGLDELEYSITEVAWPAPANLSFGDLSKPRAITLYSLRRLSMAISGFRPGTWGNRYFYAGRTTHNQAR